jgi:hypothetical protein
VLEGWFAQIFGRDWRGGEACFPVNPERCNYGEHRELDRAIAFILLAVFIRPAEPLYPLPRYSGGGLGWGFFLEFGDTAPSPTLPRKYRGRGKYKCVCPGELDTKEFLSFHFRPYP